MSASKAVLKFSQSIVVDTSEAVALPAAVKDAYHQGGASIPLVILTDPAMETIYGSFNHPQMKTQQYDTIFKKAKSDIQKALNDGSFKLGGAAPHVVQVEGAQLENWTSRKGTVIQAKLVGIEDHAIFLFARENGKILRATAKQLSPESVAKARAMAQK